MSQESWAALGLTVEEYEESLLGQNGGGDTERLREDDVANFVERDRLIYLPLISVGKA
jgi:hypothetical protein